MFKELVRRRQHWLSSSIVDSMQMEPGKTISNSVTGQSDCPTLVGSIAGQDLRSTQSTGSFANGKKEPGPDTVGCEPTLGLSHAARKDTLESSQHLPIHVPYLPADLEGASKSTKGNGPRDFLKMTAAEKRAHISAPSNNPIASGVLNEGQSKLSKDNCRTNAKCTKSFTLEKFRLFCAYPEKFPAPCKELQLILWDVNDLAVTPSEIARLDYHVAGLLGLEDFKLTRSFENCEALMNGLSRLDILTQQIRSICREWEAAIFKLPHSVQSVFIHAILPPCSVSFRREIEVSLRRIYTNARFRPEGSLGWHVRLSWNCQTIVMRSCPGGGLAVKHIMS